MYYWSFNNDVKGKKYVEFIEYALTVSTHFSFFLPYILEFSPEYTESNSAFMIARSEDQKTFEAYLESMTKKMDILQECIETQSRSYDYLGFLYGHMCETYYVLAKKQSSKAFLLSENSIFSWRYPNAPEDLVFWRDKKIWCRTIAHERMIYFDDISKEELRIVSKYVKKLKKRSSIINHQSGDQSGDGSINQGTVP